jgi:hypothetical protein
MGCEVYANGMTIACKAADGKTVAAFPDVCFTPPLTPATPPGVPIPYPNTGLASDTTEGSKTVMISGKEVMLKDKSCFKTSSGDEAGNAPKKGVVTSKIQGKVNFCAWSMDVKFEGENVPRHLDLTLHNEASLPANTPTWPYVDAQAMTSEHPCYESVQKETAACAPPGTQSRADKKGVDCSDDCKAARACALPMKKHDKAVCCHPDTTGDHLVEVNCFTQTGTRGGLNIGSEAVLATRSFEMVLAFPKSRPRRLSQFDNYDDEKAPTACANPDGTKGKHARMQAARDRIKRQCRNQQQGIPLDVFLTGEESFWTYGEAAAAGARSHKQENPQCDEKCTRAQIDAYHQEILPGQTIQEKNSTPVRTYIPSR